MTSRRPGTPRAPLDADSLERLAIDYSGRYATSRAKLERYLARKLAERGVGQGDPDPAAVAARLAALGYVDDGAVAEARGRSLSRRGLGPRRLAAALDILGIAPQDRATAMAESARTAWEDALRFAERRRIGPFAVAEGDHATRRRALATMLRAGHAFADARRIVWSPPGVVPQRDA